MTIIIKTKGSAGGAGFGYYLDRLVPVPAAGIFVFDLASPISWTTQTAPVDGDTVVDLAGLGNGDIDIQAGQSVTYAGGGFDFTGVTDDPVELRGPASILASIHGGTNQYFSVGTYVQMPIASDWNTNAVAFNMFCCTTGSTGYQGEADMLTLMQINTPQLSARRQTNGGITVAALGVSPVLHYGLFAQIMYRRTASGTKLRIKSAAGETVATGSSGSNNSGDFSAKRPRWGVPESFNSMATAEHVEAAKYKLYRGWIEDLSVTGRDPDAVADADWSRTIARGVFS
jgi:hypothetical protein